MYKKKLKPELNLIHSVYCFLSWTMPHGMWYLSSLTRDQTWATSVDVPENSEDLLSIVSIWKFSIQVLLKPYLKGFENNLTSMGSKCNCLYVIRCAFIEQLVSTRGYEK